ncbi:T9SS type A sorting domain-containing protein [Pontibacter akesuensis]|uniref:Por secretion system C-terminal sorting domain-containing protein n=1 Tax=Pontibacter akesuensis TaxID=388950 RepID=A0A1I7IEB1_9BACT|nr:T9SS type A sorting domain-containing protein [Pontibacter akesuensis]GHA66756.1 hypothetical protein GCM10007389_19780 [Pontibacter akesuensis]SFU71255.1 Por secretion system C-terminal sorting domain-containing protein [Pontibacter akesuensis]
MKLTFTLLFILVATFSGSAQAQEPLRFKLSQNIPVSTPSGQLSDPWSGGLNTPQFSSIDLNKDGQQDLFIFDRQLRKVYTWLAVQQNGKWGYQYAPAYEAFFPEDLNYWVLLRDYNCDGLQDIFTSSPLGIRVFRQEQAAQGQLQFTLTTDGLRYNARDINMQMGSADVPAISDVDGDGDLDVLLTEFSQGNYLELYRNVQVEQGLDCGTLSFVQQSDWWGGITECNGCSNFKYGEYCDTREGESIAKPTHSGHEGSSILLLDQDADGDQDLVLGGMQCNDLVLMENVGTASDALMTGYDARFPAIKPANFNLYPAAFYEDVTFDGVPDLLVAPQVDHDTWNMDFQHSVWLYRNQGAKNNPDFTFTQEDFLQAQMIDVGEGAYPAFADLDGDGDLDMLVGNQGVFRSNTYGGAISHYRNTGTATAPAFELVTHDYLALHSKQAFHIKPAFTDINGDGATDLILTFKGLQQGSTRIMLLQNLAKSGQPAAYDLAYLQVLLRVADGDSPAFADLDEDGDQDILLGKGGGGLAFYRNTGSVTSPVYTLENNTSFQGLEDAVSRRSLSPAMYDIDGNGTLDLLTVDESGEMRIFRNIKESMNGTFTAEAEVLENELTQQSQPTRLGRGLSIAVAPLGGENKPYAILGTQGGGLYLLQQTAGHQAAPEAGEELVLTIYPNPHDRSQNSGPLRVGASEPVQLEMFDMVGKLVYRSQGTYSRTHSPMLQQLQAGMYVVRAVSESGKQKSRKIILY